MLKKALIVIITAVVFKSFLEYIFGDGSKKLGQKIEKKIFEEGDLNETGDNLYLAILGILINKNLYKK